MIMNSHQWIQFFFSTSPFNTMGFWKRTDEYQEEIRWQYYHWQDECKTGTSTIPSYHAGRNRRSFQWNQPSLWECEWQGRDCHQTHGRMHSLHGKDWSLCSCWPHKQDGRHWQELSGGWEWWLHHHLHLHQFCCHRCDEQNHCSQNGCWRK